MKTNKKKRWTQEEIDYIMTSKGDYVGDTQLAYDLGRTLEAVRMKRMNILKQNSNEYPRLSVPKIRKGREYYTRWSFDELELIMESGKSDEELAKILGRSSNSIRVKRYQLEKEKEKGNESQFLPV